MSLGPWFYVLLVGIGGVHLLVALMVLRFESGRTITTEQASTESQVTCGTCGTPNDAGYRYCRQCVTALPGVSPTDQAGTATTGRELF